MSKDLIADTSYRLDSGEQVNLNAEIVRNVIAKGNNITNTEIYSFIKLCQYQKLNPFLGEAYLIKFGKTAQLVVGKDVFTNRLNEHPQCEGWQPGLILQKENGEIEEREGSFYIKGKEKIVGAWITINRKDWINPFHWSVSFHEYYREHEKDGRYVPMGQWGTMPSTMIIKCAITSGARNVFPKDFKGMYGEEEMGINTSQDEIIDIPIDGKKNNDNNNKFKKLDREKYKDNEIRYVTKEEIEKIYASINSKIIKIDAETTHKILKYILKNALKIEDTNKIPANKVSSLIKTIKEFIKKKEEEYSKESKDKKMQEMKYDNKDNKEKKDADTKENKK
jgi:phage recombination protein Bet